LKPLLSEGSRWRHGRHAHAEAAGRCAVASPLARRPSSAQLRRVERRDDDARDCPTTETPDRRSPLSSQWRTQAQPLADPRCRRRGQSTRGFGRVERAWKRIFMGFAVGLEVSKAAIAALADRIGWFIRHRVRRARHNVTTLDGPSARRRPADEDAVPVGDPSPIRRKERSCQPANGDNAGHRQPSSAVVSSRSRPA
jgi:hypothetical protein